MQNAFLIGPKVYLRPLEVEDAPALAGWFNDPEVTHYLLAYRPVSRAWEEEFVRRVADSPTDLTLGVVVREGDRLIGAAGLKGIDARDRHAGLGISLGDKGAWGRGYGTEATALLLRHAFRTLNLNRVWLEVYEYNHRAMRVYEKVGFRLEGRLRQHIFRDGRYWDTLVMGVLRDEWQPGNAHEGR